MATNLGNMNLEERAKYLALKEKYRNKILPWYRKWWGVVIIIVLGLIMIGAVASGLYIWKQVAEINAADEASIRINSDIELQRAIYGPGTNYFLGTDEAGLTIVEFADFACPYCAKAHHFARKVVDRYPGRVKFIYRDLPLHENSVDLALAARCAGEQGKFWDMHDQLFANQAVLNTTGEPLKNTIYNLAGTIGVNAALFDKCFEDQKYVTSIATDFNDALALKVEGTPSWFINGRVMSGYLEDSAFLTMLDTYMKAIDK